MKANREFVIRNNDQDETSECSISVDSVVYDSYKAAEEVANALNKVVPEIEHTVCELTPIVNDDEDDEDEEDDEDWDEEDWDDDDE